MRQRASALPYRWVMDQSNGDDGLPPPLEIVDPDDAMHALFGDKGADPYSNLGSAVLWWQAIQDRTEFLTALANLTWAPAAWGDFSEAEQIIANHSLMQNVDSLDGHEDDVAYVRFMPDTGHAMRAFGDYEISEYVILTVLRCEDGWWRVWGISQNYKPTADDILGSGTT